MSKKAHKNLRTKALIGTSSTVLGAGALYTALTNSGLVSADGGALVQNTAITMTFIVGGAFLLVVGAMVLLFVFASK